MTHADLLRSAAATALATFLDKPDDDSPPEPFPTRALPVVDAIAAFTLQMLKEQRAVAPPPKAA